MKDVSAFANDSLVTSPDQYSAVSLAICTQPIQQVQTTTTFARCLNFSTMNPAEPINLQYMRQQLYDRLLCTRVSSLERYHVRILLCSVFELKRQYRSDFRSGCLGQE